MKNVYRIVLIVFLFIQIIGNNSVFSTEKSESENIQKAKNSNISFIPLPAVAYTPETKLIFGMSGLLYLRFSGDNQKYKTSSIQPIAVYSLLKQTVFQLISNIYWEEDKNHISSKLYYIDYPTKFWGIGNRTKKEDEEKYTKRFYGSEFSYERLITSSLYIGFSNKIENNNIKDYKDEKLLNTVRYNGIEGGNFSGIGPIITWDTRDSSLSPSEGMYYKFTSLFFNKELTFSDYNYNSFELDLRNYFTVFDSHVIATRGYFKSITGSPPFFDLASLGGENTRGILSNRFSDKNLFSCELEYRFPLFWIIDYAVFGSVGEVADELKNFNSKYLKLAVGSGIRFTLDKKEKVKLRFDIGYSEKEPQFYLGFLEFF